MASRDIYDRRPTSTSRGKTHERILALQHDPTSIPGTEGLFAACAAGSLGAAIREFHQQVVVTRAVTSRRAYERTLAFFSRDVAANGPGLDVPATDLGRARIVRHLDWRLTVGLRDPGELARGALQLARLGEWIAEQTGTPFDTDRAQLRADAAERIATLPPGFHVATSASELRDTSGDARRLT